MQMCGFKLNSKGFAQNSPFLGGAGDFPIGPGVFRQVLMLVILVLVRRRRQKEESSQQAEKTWRVGKNGDEAIHFGEL